MRARKDADFQAVRWFMRPRGFSLDGHMSKKASLRHLLKVMTPGSFIESLMKRLKKL